MQPHDTTNEIPYGYCQCGCGQKTNVMTKNRTKDNRIKGQPYRFIRGHGTGPKRRSLVERFWERVQKTDGCWLWTGNGTRGRYGVIQIAGRHSKTEGAHRVSWMIHFGEIPPGMFVCHRCDCPRCVRPDHLFLGTIADNTADMVNKGRQQHGETSGKAKLTESQVHEIRALVAQGIAYPVIALQFGITPAMVSRIHLRKAWKHVP